MPRLSPYTVVTVSTPEQESRAVAETDRTVKQINDLLKKHDLPAGAFDPVARLFMQNLGGIMESDSQVARAGRQAKVTEIVKLQRERGNLQPTPGSRALAGIYDTLGASAVLQGSALSDYEIQNEVSCVLNGWTDAELDAEIARLKSIPR